MNLRVSDVQITQMLGITPRSPIDLDKLDFDLIVLHGGQGVGKSTVARAIAHALWPEKGLTAWGSVSFKTGQPGETATKSTATFVADQVEFPNRPTFADVEEFGRKAHWIRLHDLLPETPVNEKAFANHILRLADGGVDLEAAEEEVKKLSRDKARSAGSLSSDLRRIKNDLKSAEAGQSDVFADEQRLERLEGEAKELRRIQKRLSALEALKKWRAGADERDCKRAEIKESFGEGFPNARADSREQLETNAEAIASLKNEIVRETAALEEAANHSQALAFASEPPDEADLDELDTRVHGLEQAARKWERAEEELVTVLDSAKRAASIFGCHDVDPSDLLPAAKDLDSFGDFLRQAAALKKARSIHDELADNLSHPSGDSDDDDGRPAEAFLEAYLALSQWMHTAPEPVKQANETTSHRGLLSIVLMTVAAVVLAGVAAASRSLWSLGFIGLGAFSWVLYFVLGKRETQFQATGKTAPREVLERLRVELPSSWDEQDCKRRCNELHDAYACRIQALALRPVIEAHRKSEVRLNQADAELTQQRRGLKELGWNVDAIESRPEPSEALRQAIQSISQEQEHVAQAKLAERNSKAIMVDALDGLTAKLTEALGELASGEQPRDEHEARAAVKRLRTRRNSWSESDNLVSQTKEALEGLNKTLATALATRDTLLRNLHLKPEVDNRDVNLQLEEFEKWLKAKAELEKVDDSVAFLEKSANDEDLTEVELGLSKESLLSAIDEAANADEQLELRNTQIGGIREAVQNLATADTTKKLLVARDRCVTTLREKRHATEYLAVVDAVITQLRQGSDARRPKVLERADEILQLASGGELSLTSLPGDELFVDDTKGNQRRIGKLSDGERVQVALAVRLAFVQEYQQSVRCPVIIDEALANADDERAPRIIDTILEVATRGRQVIYLTSQGDEVAKWQERIEAQQGTHPDFAWRAIDLDAERRMAVRTAIPERAAWIPASLEPPVADETLGEYGRRLGRRDLDHWLAAGLQDPLWLADSLQEMFGLAQRRSGRIQFLLERSDAEDGLLAMAQRRHGLLQTIFEFVCRGRGKQVPRDAPLTSASGIGQSLAGRLFEALEKCDYEADTLLLQLDQDGGAISGLGPAAKEGLRTWLEQNDYLGDPDRKLSRDQVLGQLEGGCDPKDRAWLVRIIRNVRVGE